VAVPVAQPGTGARLDVEQGRPGYVFNATTDALPIEWTLRNEGSLETVFKVGGPAAGEAASNKVRILLKYVGKQHKPSRYVVFTAYPLP
jgi:hypothetical protein